MRIRFLNLAVLALSVATLANCASPKATDNGLKVESAAELKEQNNLGECPNLNGTYHRKDGTPVSRVTALGRAEDGVAKMSVEKHGTKSVSTDGYTIDGMKHFSRKDGSRSFDYIAICKQNRLRVAIFEGDQNIHNILYTKTLEGFDIQQKGEFGDSLTQWLPTKDEE